jgi:Tol biopolymer transport system component
MALSAGTRLGPYEIVSPAGAGGMGEVYKARDTRLNRTVAIKVLPTATVDDPERHARFEREARAIAALSHPHICVVHDVGRDGNVDYLVMEFLDGETLAALLARTKGPLPLDQALKTAIDVSDALDKAHRAGITHRDLKPANVMMTRTGAKLMDFGLAKLRGPTTPISMSGPTRLATSAPNTAQGTILGTVHYMAPEQVEGKEADGRSDIWALGAVIYEMATGKRPFDGESPASVMAAILKDHPPGIATSQPATPAALDHIVRTSLAKDPDDRWQSAGDLARQLRWIAETGSRATVGASKRWPSTPSVLVSVTAAAALIVAATVLASRALNRQPTYVPALRLALAPPKGTGFGRSAALSPDGRWLTFIASTAGASVLWVRALSALEGHPLAGTEGASLPFWSPDNRSIGFFAGGKLKTVEAAGSSPVTLCDAYAGRGGTWLADGTIIYAPGWADPLYRVAASGGDSKPLTTLDRGRGESAHLWPWILPDQRHFVFLVRSQRPEYQGIHVGSLNSSDRVRLTDADSNAQYARPGYLLFARGQNLMAQEFNTRAFALTGNAVRIAEGLLHTPGSQVPGFFSVSDSGTLVYVSGSSNPRVTSKFAWVDRSGNVIDQVGDSRPYTHMVLSPDGHHIAVLVSVTPGLSHIWSNIVPDTDVVPFTFGQANDAGIVWSRTATEVLWASARPELGFYKKPSNGSGSEQMVWRAPAGATTANQIEPTDWSPDGRHVLFQRAGKNTGWDLWVLPLFGDREARPLIQTPSDDGQGQFSPDGRWVAYTSNESGRPEVYVQHFPPTGAQRQVSVAGGMLPKWRGDGRELFFIVPGTGRMMAADVITEENFQSNTPHFLFRLPYVLTHGSEAGGHYGVAPDGQRLLVQFSDESQVQSLNVVINWTSDLIR